jgi:hypothetical protein
MYVCVYVYTYVCICSVVLCMCIVSGLGDYDIFLILEFRESPQSWV